MHELHVDLVGPMSDAHPVLSRLDEMLGYHDASRFDAGPPESGLGQSWYFPEEADALHAGELARDLLERSVNGLAWRVWISTTETPDGWLLAEREE